MSDCPAPVAHPSLQLLECGMAFNPAVSHAAEIVSAFVSHNAIPAADVPALIKATYAVLSSLGEDPSPLSTNATSERKSPAEIKRSITPDALISFIDGKAYKTLKRHLTKHSLDFEGYRQRYGLPADYPSTAPSYSEQRAALARAAGLGKRPASAGMQAAA